MTTVFMIVAVFVLAAIPSVLHVCVSKRRSPVTLTILAGIPLVLSLCAATYVCIEGGGQTGSFLLTLAGGFLGGLVAGICSFFFWLTGVETFLLAPALLIAPVSATLGFNRTRRYKEPPSP